MNELIKILKQLSIENPINKFEWSIPTKCPVTIPRYLADGYSKNIYLKEKLGNSIRSDKNLTSHYWVIQEWGGIGSFKKNKKTTKE